VEYDQIYLKTRNAWRKWLTINHSSFQGIWLIHYKKYTGKPNIAYNDAVEEALCFGWVDSLVKRIDEERYMQKYTPRKPNSSWSEWNKVRVAKMIDAGLMTEVGIKMIEIAQQNGKWDGKINAQRVHHLSEDLRDILETDEIAYMAYKNLPPSQKKMHNIWIMDAKKEETRIRRLEKFIGLLKEGKRMF